MPFNLKAIPVIGLILLVSIVISIKSVAETPNIKSAISLLEANNPEDKGTIIKAMLHEAKVRNDCTRVIIDPIYDHNDILHSGRRWLSGFDKYGDDAISILQDALEADIMCVRRTAVGILSIIENSEPLPLLIKAMSDADPGVRSLAIGRIGVLTKIKDWDVDYPITTIIDISKYDEDQEVRRKAITTLRYIQESLPGKIRSACINGLSDISDNVKAVSALCVGRLEAYGASNLIVNIIINPDVSIDVKRYAYFALSKILSSKSDVEFLLNGLKDENYLIRSEVAGAITDRQVRTAIRNILYPDSDKEFTKYIISTLKETLKNETNNRAISSIESYVRMLESEVNR